MNAREFFSHTVDATTAITLNTDADFLVAHDCDPQSPSLFFKCGNSQIRQFVTREGLACLISEAEALLAEIDARSNPEPPEEALRAERVAVGELPEEARPS